MKHLVTIEEHIAQDFIIDVPDGVDIVEYISGKYYNNMLVVEHGECYYRQMLIHTESNDSTAEWIEF